MPIAARYVHTNIVAHDWRRLAAFYVDVLGCEPVPPERDLRGEWIAAATGIPGVQIQGLHLRLPGCGPAGPTLEVFQYSQQTARTSRGVNQPGLAHLAFAVEDVPAAVEAVLAAGGSLVGEVVHTEIDGIGALCFAYAADPEGNIIELQHWG